MTASSIRGRGWAWLISETITWLAALSVAGAAALMSFDSLAELAGIAQIAHGWMTNLLPIVIDAGILVAAKFHLTPRYPARARRFAGRLTLSLLMVTALGNIAAHVYADTPPRLLWLIIAASVIPPLTFAAVHHLLMIASIPEPTPAPPARVEQPPVLELEPMLRKETEPVTRPIQKVAPKAPEAPAAPPAQEGTKETRESADGLSDPRHLWIVDQLRAELEEKGKLPSQRWIIDNFNVHNNTARKLVEVAKNNGHKVL
jgi:hypothetical protein